MIAFYCTIPHANSVPLPPRLNISLRYNFLSRLYHFRVLEEKERNIVLG